MLADTEPGRATVERAAELAATAEPAATVELAATHHA